MALLRMNNAPIDLLCIPSLAVRNNLINDNAAQIIMQIL